MENNEPTRQEFDQLNESLTDLRHTVDNALVKNTGEHAGIREDVSYIRGCVDMILKRNGSNGISLKGWAAILTAMITGIASVTVAVIG